MSIPHRVWFLGLLFLAGCAAVPKAPETTWYRLPDAAPVEALAEPAVALPMVVEVFHADGLYSDQALVYTLDDSAERLRTYHYQLWIDPPGRLLQRRLIDVLRASRVSLFVTDRLPTRVDALRVSGRIARLDRVRTAHGWEVAVSLVLRAEPSAGGRPWVVGEYHRQLPVEGGRVGDSVRVMAQAIDQIHADFIADLQTHAQRLAAGDETPLVR